MGIRLYSKVPYCIATGVLQMFKGNYNPFSFITIFIKLTNLCLLIVCGLYNYESSIIGYCYLFKLILILVQYISVLYCIVLYCRCWCIVSFYIFYMDRINWTENAALPYCIDITTYCKPHTVWPFPVQHQSEDRYTKCTEHYTDHL
jgi:hypothetical protein